MSIHDDEPELAGYEPSDRPLRSRKMKAITRVVVVLGLLALVLPGVMTTISVGSRTAQASCAIWVAYEEPGAISSVARFEFFGDGLVGWECYTVGAFGGDYHVVSLGLIPGTPKLPAPGGVDS
ncbi:MAG: putative rane protein [Glaciihabitans sp.]|nr:putative rane protein [Glaciihabitans sp.]